MVTTLLFVLVGATLWSADAKVPGGLVLAMAAYRGFFVARGLWWWLGPDDEEDLELED